MIQNIHMTRNLLDIKGAKDFQKAFDVSRETLERFEIYMDLLKRWQKAKNLVANKTLDVAWQRHFADSAQAFEYVKGAKVWYDFGSGAGFPGLIFAIFLADNEYRKQYPDQCQLKMYESNGKKCAFLHEVVRKTRISEFVTVEIHNSRIETLRESAHSIHADVVTARALAPLVDLIGLSSPIFGKSTRGIFLKGRDAQEEIHIAEKSWRFSYELVPSKTDPEGSIVLLDSVQPV